MFLDARLTNYSRKKIVVILCITSVVILLGHQFKYQKVEKFKTNKMKKTYRTGDGRIEINKKIRKNTKQHSAKTLELDEERVNYLKGLINMVTRNDSKEDVESQWGMGANWP